MKKLLFITLVFLLLMNFLNAQRIGAKMFPIVETKTLNNERLVLPKDLNKKANIIILAFVQEAQVDVNTWADIILREYEPKEAVSYYEVPMMNGFYRPFQKYIDNGMRSGIPDKLHDNTATYYGPRRDIFKYLDIEDRSTCYVFLVDEKGYVRFRAAGAMSDSSEYGFRKTINGLLEGV